MRKFIVAAAVVLGFMSGGVSASYAQQEWVAVAAYGTSHFVGRGWSEEGARAVALDQCATYTGRTCSRRLSASVPSSTWFLVVVQCPNGKAAGGSRLSFENAKHMAAQRRGYPAWACAAIDWGN